MRTRTRVTQNQNHKEDSRCPSWPAGENVYKDLIYSQGVFQDPGIPTNVVLVNESGSTETIIDNPSPVKMEKYVKHTRYSVEEHPPIRQKLGFSRFSPGAAQYRALQDTIFDTNSPHCGIIARGSYWRTLQPITSASLPTLSAVPTSVQLDAFEHMMPKVNDGLSIVNFILELKDLRRMFDFKTLERELQKGYRKFGILSNKITANQSKKDRWQVLKDTANDFLNYSFGWKPFLGDLAKMYKALNGLSKRLDYLERNQGRALRRHYSRDLDVAAMPCSKKTLLWNSDINLLYRGDGAHNTYGAKAKVFRRDSYDYLPRYHATVDYSYTLPSKGLWQKTRRTIRGYLDAFGVRLDPSIIWNAIPFSFVVDWVIDVGSWLRRFSPNDLGIEVVIEDASHSVKYSQVSQITAELPVLTPENSSGIRTVSHYVNIDVSDALRTYYERDRWNPSSLLAGVSTPTLMQWALGGALAISKDRKRFRRG